MKIYGLLGLCLSVLSAGATAEGQVLIESSAQGCQNCSQAVDFSAQTSVSQSVSSAAFPTDSYQAQSQPIYQDATVAPATYVASDTYIPADMSTASYSATTVSATNFHQPIARTPVSSFASNVRSGLAQTKAASAARMGLRGHLGGGLGNAKYEGVGWSNQSAQSAIQNCCYWGTRPVSEIGVSQGSDGCWYACVLYQ